MPTSPKSNKHDNPLYVSTHRTTPDPQSPRHRLLGLPLPSLPKPIFPFRRPSNVSKTLHNVVVRPLDWDGDQNDKLYFRYQDRHATGVTHPDDPFDQRPFVVNPFAPVDPTKPRKIVEVSIKIRKNLKQYFTLRQHSQRNGDDERPGIILFVIFPHPSSSRFTISKKRL